MKKEKRWKFCTVEISVEKLDTYGVVCFSIPKGSDIRGFMIDKDGKYLHIGYLVPESQSKKSKYLVEVFNKGEIFTMSSKEEFIIEELVSIPSGICFLTVKKA